MTIIRTNVKTDKNCQEEDVKICIIKRQQYQNRGNINFAHCMNCERFEQMAKAHDDEVAAAKNFIERGVYTAEKPKSKQTLYDHTCAFCGKPFANRKIDATYCSRECCIEAQKKRDAEALEAKRAEREKKRAEKASLPKRVTTGHCKKCGVEIMITRNRKYCETCSVEMKKLHKHENRLKHLALKNITPKKEEAPMKDSAVKPDSGRFFPEEISALQPPPKVVCRFCGKAYDPATVEGKFNHEMFCSQECVDNWLAKFPPDDVFRKREAGILEYGDIGECPTCGKYFDRTRDYGGYNGFMFCSKKCGDEFVNKKVTLERDPKDPEKLKCVVKDEPKTEQPKPVFNVPSKVDQLIFVWRQKGAELQARKTMLEVEAKHNEEMLGLVKEFLKDLSFIPRSNS